MAARGGAGRGEATLARADPRRGQAPWRRIVLLVILVSAAGGCATVDPWEDARIESEIKARLVAEKTANLTRLGVLSKKATVYLSGTVQSADHRMLAERLAKSVTGVRRVVNTLDVRSAPE
jgi:predicted ATPase